MTTYERGHMDISGTTRPAVYPYLNPTVDSDPPAWENIDTVAFFKASEFHLYGSDRLGIYSPNQWMAFLTNEDSLILPEYNYDLHAYDGDPCGCDTTSTGTSPPNDPCWCEDDDPCACPACLNCIDCYCSGWPTTDFSFISASHQVRGFIRGRKRYELKNHLGNVLEVISDRKLQITSDSLTVDGYNPDIWAWHDYNPFGTTQQARSWQATGYRYGFQGQEADDELFGADNAIAFTYRMYDARIGRFLSIDPEAEKYPWNSPYAFADGNPIAKIDKNGLHGEISIEGNSITISSVILISGDNVTKEQIQRVQDGINKYWDKDFSYLDKESGITYSVKFNTTVTSEEYYNENEMGVVSPFAVNDLILIDRASPDDPKRIMENGEYRSHVDGGNSGFWDSQAEDYTYGHEFAHFLGFADQYYEYTVIRGGLTGLLGTSGMSGEENYPGTPSNSILGMGVYEENPKVTQEMIDAISSFALEKSAQGELGYNSKIFLDASGYHLLEQPEGMDEEIRQTMYREVKNPHDD